MFQKVAAIVWILICVVCLCTSTVHIYTTWEQETQVAPIVMVAVIFAFLWVGVALVYNSHPPYPGTIESLFEGEVYTRAHEWLVDSNTNIVIFRDSCWRLLCIDSKHPLMESSSYLYMRKGNQILPPDMATKKEPE